MEDPKCDACNRIEALAPCGFCNQPVTIRYNTMTGVHYITHEDLNSRCPQRPFYGSAEQWNHRVTEDALRAEIGKWIEAANLGTKLINEQDREIERLRGIIRAAHNTFTQGGTDPADDDVISLLMAKILEEALF